MSKLYLLTFFTLLAFSINCWGQTYKTDYIIKKADSLFKLASADSSFTKNYVFDNKASYYQYSAKDNDLRLKKIKLSKQTRGKFEAAQVYYVSVDGKCAMMVISVEPEDMEGNIGEQANKNILALAIGTFKNNSNKPIEISRVYNSGLSKQRLWEVGHFYSFGKNKVNKYGHQYGLEKVLIDPMNGKIILYDTDAFYRTWAETYDGPDYAALEKREYGKIIFNMYFK